jgi:phenylacetate-CoA ligase
MGSVLKFVKRMPKPLQRLSYKVIPFSIRYGAQYRDTYSFITKSQWWDTDKLRRHQLTELTKLLEHAYENVPYYKEIFDQRHLKPKDIRSIPDMQKLPILTREIIRSRYSDLTARNTLNSRTVKFSTSGSTGNRLTFTGTESMYKKEAAFITRSFNSHGSKLYKEKSVWLRRYVPEGSQPVFMHDYELNRLYLSAYNLSPSSVKEYVNIINSYGAKLLVGYPSSLYILALLLEESGLRLNNITAAHAASEKMLREWKQKIEAVLNIPVKCHYGMIEKVAFFFQCGSSDCYHENLEYGVTEFINGPNGVPEVVGTGFLNYAMPLIRYKPNDCAKLNVSNQQCKCGRGLPLTVEDFEGRSDDILLMPDGRLLPGVNFYTMMYKIDGVQMFQIVQHSPDAIEVKIVPSASFNDGSMVSLREGLGKRIGKAGIDIKLVNEIERSRTTGKIRCIVSRCGAGAG